MKMLKRLFLKRTDCNQKNESHLIDQDFICLLFNTEKTTLASAAQRIKKLIDSGLDPYDVNIVQHQMIDVAQAYLERVVLEQFQETIQDIKDKTAKKLC
jgi:acyl-CoA oxidase